MRTVFCVAILSLMALISGCSSGSGSVDVGAVTGTITLDGNPLPNAKVQFEPEVGRPSFGTTDSQGKYSLTYTADRSGALVGRHTVRIRSEVEAEEDGQPPKVKEFLPKKYHVSSELSAEVKPGKNVVDFALESK